MKSQILGPLLRDSTWIKNRLADDPIRNYIIVAYDTVFDVSAYLDPVLTPNFLGPNMLKLFKTYGQSGGIDVTAQLNQIKSSEGSKQFNSEFQCMSQLFYNGAIDHRQDYLCQVSNLILLVSSVFLIGIIGMKFLAAIQFESQNAPQPQDKYVIAAVPCFNEGAATLEVCIKSIAASKYAEGHILLFIVVDGSVVGAGNDKSTDEIIVDLLSVDSSLEPPIRMYESLGEGSLQLNFARVYSGFYKHNTKPIPYVLVLKTGDHSESYRPGNRYFG